MGFELFINGIFIGFVVSIPLGPIGVLCVQRTINKGRLSGFISGLGAAVADTVFALLAGLGISIIISFIEKQKIYFQVFGGLIILLLGIHIFYSNPIRQIRLKRLNRNNYSQDFLSVFFLTISNPMAIFFFLAMFAGVNLVSGPVTFFNLTSVVSGIAIGATTWWFLLSTIVNLFRDRFRLRIIWWMNKIAGVVIVLLGVAAVLSIWFLK